MHTSKMPAAAVEVRVLAAPALLAYAEKIAEGRSLSVTPPVSVELLPFVAEQGSSAFAQAASVPMAVSEVLSKCRQEVVQPAAISVWGGETAVVDAEYWASHLPSFLSKTCPGLPSVAVVVTHGNFLRAQVCGRALCPSPVPNGGVVMLTQGSRSIFFVRHCTTCHNIDKRGSVALTMCHDFDALAGASALARALRRKFGSEECRVFSSPMPRAILTAIALQRDVSPRERLSFCRAFDACQAPIGEAQVRAHRRRWSCTSSQNADSAFCSRRVSDADEDGD